MSVHVVVGAQWGDEGKGKIVDVLGATADVVARYQGGNNAGHTVEIGPQKFVLHLIPSGIFHPGVTVVIGNGTVIDPEALLEEIAMLEGAGITVAGRLKISSNAHVIMPWHKRLDALQERGADPIGTTGRGIGPAYTDKTARTGIRMADFVDPARLGDRFQRCLAEKNATLAALHGAAPLDGRLLDAARRQAEVLAPYVDDTVHFLHAALHRGERILCEGAQGALLDVDHGTYPYVTSSSPISGGATTGLGLPPTAVRQVTGIVKAYCTRVGNGPFPTELNDATGELLRRTGREFGSTTGRPRRCGWLDMVALRYSIMINGITAIAFMKLDVLDELDEIRVCNAYDIDGHRLDHYPTNLALLERVTPVLTSFTGWRTSLVSRTSYDDLPPQARHYVEAVEAMAGVPVSHLSIGPGREQTIRMQPELE